MCCHGNQKNQNTSCCWFHVECQVSTRSPIEVFLSSSDFFPHSYSIYLLELFRRSFGLWSDSLSSKILFYISFYGPPHQNRFLPSLFFIHAIIFQNWIWRNEKKRKIRMRFNLDKFSDNDLLNFFDETFTSFSLKKL